MDKNNSEKKFYSHPKIFSLGSVKNLTQTKSGTKSDMQGTVVIKHNNPIDELDLLEEQY